MALPEPRWDSPNTELPVDYITKLQEQYNTQGQNYSTALDEYNQGSITQGYEQRNHTQEGNLYAKLEQQRAAGGGYGNNRFYSSGEIYNFDPNSNIYTGSISGNTIQDPGEYSASELNNPGSFGDYMSDDPWHQILQNPGNVNNPNYSAPITPAVAPPPPEVGGNNEPARGYQGLSAADRKAGRVPYDEVSTEIHPGWMVGGFPTYLGALGWTAVKDWMTNSDTEGAAALKDAEQAARDAPFDINDVGNYDLNDINSGLQKTYNDNLSVNNPLDKGGNGGGNQNTGSRDNNNDRQSERGGMGGV
jgi:hypothetical protein